MQFDKYLNVNVNAVNDVLMIPGIHLLSQYVVMKDFIIANGSWFLHIICKFMQLCMDSETIFKLLIKKCMQALFLRDKIWLLF